MENKILIALFMGYIQNGDDEFLIHPETNFDHAVEGTDWFLYDTNWEWLMPVVEKIDQLGASVIIGRMFCEIKYIDPLHQEKTFDVRIASGVKINAVIGAVVEFINWYNLDKLPLKTWEWTCSTNTILTSFDCGEVQAKNIEEARALAIKQLKYDVKKVNEVLDSADVTSGFTIEFNLGNLEVTEKYEHLYNQFKD